jgi:threonine dehydratase
VVAASAGNHAQAVAYHATQRGIRARIVMPLMTPLVERKSSSTGQTTMRPATRRSGFARRMG